MSLREGAIEAAAKAFNGTAKYRDGSKVVWKQVAWQGDVPDITLAFDAMLDYLEAWSLTENEVMMPVCELIGALRSEEDH